MDMKSIVVPSTGQQDVLKNIVSLSKLLTCLTNFIVVFDIWEHK